jgi:hypothetical protein
MTRETPIRPRVSSVSDGGWSLRHRRAIARYNADRLRLTDEGSIDNPGLNKTGIAVIAALNNMAWQAANIHPWFAWHGKVFFTF